MRTRDEVALGRCGRRSGRLGDSLRKENCVHRLADDVPDGDMRLLDSSGDRRWHAQAVIRGVEQSTAPLSAARLTGTEPIGQLDDDQVVAIRSVLGKMLDL